MAEEAPNSVSSSNTGKEDAQELRAAVEAASELSAQQTTGQKTGFPKRKNRAGRPRRVASWRPEALGGYIKEETPGAVHQVTAQPGSARAANNRTRPNKNTRTQNVPTMIPDGKGHRCSECRKKFPKPSALARHIRTHTGERPFKCRWLNCGTSFAERGNLKRHMRVHTGERPYQCPVPSCDSRFARRAHLEQHLKTRHTGQEARLGLQSVKGRRGRKKAMGSNLGDDFIRTPRIDDEDPDPEYLPGDDISVVEVQKRRRYRSPKKQPRASHAEARRGLEDPDGNCDPPVAPMTERRKKKNPHGLTLKINSSSQPVSPVEEDKENQGIGANSAVAGQDVPKKATAMQLEGDLDKVYEHVENVGRQISLQLPTNMADFGKFSISPMPSGSTSSSLQGLRWGMMSPLAIKVEPTSSAAGSSAGATGAQGRQPSPATALFQIPLQPCSTPSFLKPPSPRYPLESPLHFTTSRVITPRRAFLSFSPLTPMHLFSKGGLEGEAPSFEA